MPSTCKKKTVYLGVKGLIKITKIKASKTGFGMIKIKTGLIPPTLLKKDNDKAKSPGINGKITITSLEMMNAV